MTRFSDIVTKPEQVEVAIAKAQIAWVTAQACSVVQNLPEFFDARLGLMFSYSCEEVKA